MSNVKQLLFDACGKTYSLHIAWTAESTRNLGITYTCISYLYTYIYLLYIYLYIILFIYI